MALGLKQISPIFIPQKLWTSVYMCWTSRACPSVTPVPAWLAFAMLDWKMVKKCLDIPGFQRQGSQHLVSFIHAPTRCSDLFYNLWALTIADGVKNLGIICACPNRPRELLHYLCRYQCRDPRNMKNIQGCMIPPKRTDWFFRNRYQIPT